MKIKKINIRAIILSSIVVVIATTLITILGELLKPFKDLLTIPTGHHWVTKSILAFLIFIILIFIFGKEIKDRKEDLWKEVKLLSIIITVSTLALFIFFVLHFFYW